MDTKQFARRVALILGISFPVFNAALTDGRAVMPPRWMVEAYLSDAVVKPSRDDIARAIIPGMGFVPAFLGGGGPTTPAVFVAVSANGNGNTAAMPSGWAVGDLLLIVAAAYAEGSSIGGHNTPAGWVQLDSYANVYAGGGYTARIKVFYRIAQSGDTTVTLTLSDGVGWASCMLAYRGVDTSSPFEATTSLSNQSAASTIPYAQLTVGANRVVLQVISSWATEPVSSMPGASWIERFDSGGNLGVSLDERTFTSAGTTPAGNQTKSVSAPWGRMAFALKPA